MNPLNEKSSLEEAQNLVKQLLERRETVEQEYNALHAQHDALSQTIDNPRNATSHDTAKAEAATEQTGALATFTNHLKDSNATIDRTTFSTVAGIGEIGGGVTLSADGGLRSTTGQGLGYWAGKAVEAAQTASQSR